MPDTTLFPEFTIGGAGPKTYIQATANGSASAISASITATPGKISWLTGFAITGTGATATSTITISVSGCSLTFFYLLTIPAGATIGITPLIVEFSDPIPGSAVNTAVTVSVPSFGAGNTNSQVSVHGFVQ